MEAGSVEPALRLGHALSHYWFLRGYMSEGRAALDMLLALPGVDEHAELLSLVLDRAGLLAAYQADFDRAMQLSERCLAIRRGLGDREGIAEILANQAYVLLHRDDFDRAVEVSHESLAIQREIGSDQGRADALSSLALIAYYRGDPPGRPVTRCREPPHLGSARLSAGRRRGRCRFWATSRSASETTTAGAAASSAVCRRPSS